MDTDFEDQVFRQGKHSDMPFSVNERPSVATMPSMMTDEHIFDQVKYNKKTVQRASLVKNDFQLTDPQFRDRSTNFGQTNVEYHLDLSVEYTTVPGQYVHVIGSIPELGNWQDESICKLQWTEGHIWKTVEPIKTRKSFFMYKYVLMDEGVRVKLEDGIDRIADLELLSLPSNDSKI